MKMHGDLRALCISEGDDDEDRSGGTFTGPFAACHVATHTAVGYKVLVANVYMS